MDKEEKRRLKKLGKKVVEEQSLELKRLMEAANPAPIGSDAWIRLFRDSGKRQRKIDAAQPDIIPADIATEEFVLHYVEPSPHGVPTVYLECPRCRDLLHSEPLATVQCSCRGIELNLEMQRILVRSVDYPRWTTLIARGEPKRKPWWRFW